MRRRCAKSSIRALAEPSATGCQSLSASEAHLLRNSMAAIRHRHELALQSSHGSSQNHRAMSSVASARSRDEAVTSKGSVTRLDLLSRASVTASTPLHATVAEAEAPKGDGDHRACARALQPDRASTGSYWHSSNNDLAAPISVAYTFAGWTSPSSWWGARLDRAADAARQGFRGRKQVTTLCVVLLRLALLCCCIALHCFGNM